MFRSPLRRLCSPLRTFVFAAGAVFPVVTMAQTGVSDDRVSLPDGPGSLDGVGDNASVNANMGLMQTSIPISIPNGYGGVTPDFTLSYSSGAGSGPLGIGWSMAVPSIERMTAKGLPSYVDQDLFVADGSSELVRISGGEPAIYRARYEGSFVRYAWHDRGSGDAGYWTAEFPSGEIATFGAAFDGTPTETARLRSNAGVFRYLVTEVRDRFGHTVDYSYRFYGSVPLVDVVGYAHDSDGVPRYTVAFDYEDRPDAISDARGGFNELLTKRLSTIRVLSKDAGIRRYDIDYEDEETAGSLSRIQRVTRFGRDGGQYGVVNSYEYSRSIAGVCDGTDCEEPLLVDAGNIGASFATGKVNLIDLNGDGLPDAIESQATGPHRIYLGQMTPDGVSSFAAPFDSEVGDAGTFELSNPFTQVLDVNGDGFTDLINSLAGRVLLNRGEGDWSENVSITGGASLPDFSEDFELDEDGQLEHIRFVDVDLDRRIDVIRADEVGTSMFRNMGDAGFVADNSVQDLEAGFADDSTDFADMNGDGLLDPVQIREGVVRYRIHLGQGQWTNWTSISGAPIVFEDIPNTHLEDLNGDGIDDIVAVVGGQVKYALNRNSLFFTEQESLTSTRGQPLPVDNGTTVVLFADMNANGSTDVVYVDDEGNVTYLDLFPVRPNLLSRIENGIGYVANTTYSTIIEERARTQGENWDDPVPMPSIVVKSLDVFTEAPTAELTIHELVNYAYDSAFYDGIEKQFRGFRTTTTTEETETGTVVRTEVFDVGAGDNRGHFAGNTLREEIREDDIPVQTVTRTFEDCPVGGIPNVDALRTPILYSCLTAEETVRHEKRPTDEWTTLRSEFTVDGYGNQTRAASLGVVDIGGAGCTPCTRPAGTTGEPCGAQCEGDEEYIETTFVSPETNDDIWLLNLPAVVRERAIEGGDAKEERFFYDGEAFDGLPEGRATKGNLTRQTALALVGEPPIPAVRSRFDLHGNLVEGIAPNGPASGSHRVRTFFDDTGLFPTRIERDVSTEDGRITLARDYIYDEDFGVVESATAWYRVGEDPSATRTRWTYDEHAQLASATRPTAGGLPDAVTEEYEYIFATPYTRVVERARSDVDGGLDLETVTCLDGLGREVQSRVKVGEGNYQVSGHTVYDRQGNAVRVFRETLSAVATCEPPPEGTASSTFTYDAVGREVLAVLPDSDRAGGASERRTIYFPLETHYYNEDDNDPTSPGADTPNVARLDGLDRVVSTTRALPGGENEVNQIVYDGLGRIARVIDSQGNEKVQQYDLLDRVLNVVDPDANRVDFTYNKDGAVTLSEDARGVVIRREYDDLGRLVEEWDDANRAGTLVTYVFDEDPECTEVCANQAGKLVATEYESPLGRVRESFEYDARGNVVALRQVAQGVEIRIEYTFDNADRLISTTYPDGQVVAQVLDAGGRAIAYDGLIDTIEYAPEGQATRIVIDDSIATTFAYNARGSLTAMATMVRGNAVLDLSYTHDRLEKITSVEDNVRVGPQSLGATFNYDALGCLEEATFDGETLSFASDTLSRLIQKQSTLGRDSKAHVGDLSYDTTAVRQVVTAGETEWRYDAAGYTESRGNDTFAFDLNGRMKSISRAGVPLVEVTRTSAGDRLLTREGNSLRRHLGGSFEIRDGISRVRVAVGTGDVLMLESDSLASELLDDRVSDGVINAADAFAVRGESDQGLILKSAARRALLDVQGPKTVLLPDAQGSTVGVLSADGEVRERLAYYPYGGIRVATAERSEFARYTGNEHDSTGYLDYGERVLSPTEGRWLSPDPTFLVLDGSIAQSPAEAFSAYAFVANDPINFVDLKGLKSAPTAPPGPPSVSFGSFATVQAHSPPPAGVNNAAAYAIGNPVAFSSQAPSVAAVAHEAPHIVQQVEAVSAPANSVSAGNSVNQEAPAPPAASSITNKSVDASRSQKPTIKARENARTSRPASPRAKAATKRAVKRRGGAINSAPARKAGAAKTRVKRNGAKAFINKVKKAVKRVRNKISKHKRNKRARASRAKSPKKAAKASVKGGKPAKK